MVKEKDDVIEAIKKAHAKYWAKAAGRFNKSDRKRRAAKP